MAVLYLEWVYSLWIRHLCSAVIILKEGSTTYTYWKCFRILNHKYFYRCVTVKVEERQIGLEGWVLPVSAFEIGNGYEEC